MKQLISVEVKNILGNYDHRFEFPLEDEFVILHGPNGVGKTRLLGLISDVMRGRSPRRNTPFDSARLTFSDDSWIEVSREGRTTRWSTSRHENLPVRQVVDDELAISTAARDLMEQGLIRRVPMSSRVEGAMYRDAETAERLTATQAVDRFAEDLDPAKLPVPLEVRDFVSDLRVSLVEVNRLRSFEGEPERHDARTFRERPQISAVVYYSRELAKKITLARSQHAIFAQQLDGTYPQRLLAGRVGASSSEKVLALQQELTDLREKLQTAALLEVDESLVDLDVQNLTGDWKLAALQLHYEDSLEKLQQLQPLGERILLFRELVSSKFTDKKLHLSADQGYAVTTPAGTINPGDLSSGEQHELVMTYQLIFESQRSQLVLIDEPEVSLHVHWQRQFLDDLQKISKLDDIRFIVATHSPQIVGRWAKRMESLDQGRLR